MCFIKLVVVTMCILEDYERLNMSWFVSITNIILVSLFLSSILEYPPSDSWGLGVHSA